MLVLKPRNHGIVTAREMQQACPELKQVMIERHPIKVIQSELRAFPEYFKTSVGAKHGSLFIEKLHWRVRDDFVKAGIHLDVKNAADKAMVHWAASVYESKHCGIQFESFFYEKLITEAGFQQLLDTIGAPEGSSAKLAMKELERDSQVREEFT